MTGPDGHAGAGSRPPGAPDEPSPVPSTASQTWGQVVIGVGLVLLGVLWLVDAGDLADIRWRLVLPALLVALGAVSVGLGLARRGADLTGAGVVLSIVVVVLALAPGRVGLGVGDRDEEPVRVADLQAEYTHGIGRLTVDLRGLDLDRDRSVSAGLLIGEVVVRIPEGIELDAEASAAVGEVRILDRDRSGISPRLRHRPTDTVPGDDGAPDDAAPARPVLSLDVSVGIGSVEVSR